ncbi:MAG TPA: lysogenization regulator HflD [Gammaproteobacteria bacterium]|nr:lysogenization regulator HflD [Gammaproteobacteria bacterium]|tara:strand:+ start:912 stop:1535 length:624 start_codon:yes stop_codon:yes gene_type:complete
MKVAFEERILALAGIVQAASLVNSAAKSRMVSQNSLDASLQSIFITNPDDVTQVFDGLQGISLGVRVLSDILDELRITENAQIIRYCTSIITLERQLSKRRETLAALGDRIAVIDEHRHTTNPPLLNDTIIAELAELYQASVGPSHIQIMGKRYHLENSTNVNRIRALLLAGIRAAVLWHQLGGRRWQIVTSHKKMLEALRYVQSIH